MCSYKLQRFKIYNGFYIHDKKMIFLCIILKICFSLQDKNPPPIVGPA
jgi:hypothetical protein